MATRISATSGGTSSSAGVKGPSKIVRPQRSRYSLRCILSLPRLQNFQIARSLQEFSRDTGGDTAAVSAVLHQHRERQRAALAFIRRKAGEPGVRTTLV